MFEEFGHLIWKSLPIQLRNNSLLIYPGIYWNTTHTATAHLLISLSSYKLHRSSGNRMSFPMSGQAFLCYSTREGNKFYNFLECVCLMLPWGRKDHELLFIYIIWIRELTEITEDWRCTFGVDYLKLILYW